LLAREGRIDLEAMAQFLTEDATRIGPRPSFVAGSRLPGSPMADHFVPGQPVQGRERILEGFADKNTPYEPDSIRIEIENLTAEGDYVSAQYTWRARTRMGLPYENYYHHLHFCENGRIKTIWAYVDTLYSSKMLSYALDGTESDG
jgi:ketosteroid isomerase-like protein